MALDLKPRKGSGCAALPAASAELRIMLCELGF